MESASNEEREIRAARNQALFRAVNDKMLELNETFGDLVGSFSVACECARIDCVDLLEIPGDAYRAVRESPRFFVVRPDHVWRDVERVVSTHDGYAVVEALGDGAQIADATFQRGRPATADR
jgi:hypothetical protein